MLGALPQRKEGSDVSTAFPPTTPVCGQYRGFPFKGSVLHVHLDSDERTILLDKPMAVYTAERPRDFICVKASDLAQIAPFIPLGAIDFPATPGALAADPVFSEPWYFRVELMPGLVTPGQLGHSTVLARKLLARASVKDQRCLDIGPMEGLISALLARRGAGVTAIDITQDHAKRVAYLQHYLGVKIEHHAPVFLNTAHEFFGKRGGSAFDIVVCAGVLYHTVDFIGSIAHARMMARPGGLMIVESWIDIGDNPAMGFNMAGSITDEMATFWFPSVALFDYLLRFNGLCPIDCGYYRIGDRMRFAVACRVMGDSVVEPSDAWMSRAAQSAEMIEYAKLRLAVSTSEVVPYATRKLKKVSRDGTKAIDLFAYTREYGPDTDSQEASVLQLSDAL